MINGSKVRTTLLEDLFDQRPGPPPCPVEWLVFERSNPRNATYVYAQTAFKAWEVANIRRDGLCLPFSACETLQCK